MTADEAKIDEWQGQAEQPLSDTLRQIFVRVEAHVALGERHISDQRTRIANLLRDGHDVARSRQLLATFEDTQRFHIAYRDRLRKEVDEANKNPTTF